MSKIFVAIPTLGDVSMGIVTWLLNGNKFDHEIRLFFPCERPSSRAHRVLQREFLATDFDYCLKLDCDMNPSMDILKLADHGLDIVSAATKTIQGDNIIRLAMREVAFREYEMIPFEKDEGIIECDAVGSGALMMSRAALEANMFPHVTDEIRGIDLEWCRLSKESGFRVWYDTKMPCAHKVIAPL